jgi:hypothetical protein
VSDAIIKLVREITSEFNSIPAICWLLSDLFLSLRAVRSLAWFGGKRAAGGGPRLFSAGCFSCDAEVAFKMHPGQE